MSPVFWDDQGPSSLPRVPIQVFRVPPTGKAFIRFLGNVVGVWTHWLEGRSTPCMGKECRHCHDGAPQRWKSYAPALWWRTTLDQRTGKRASQWISVVEITEGLGELVGRPLRGQVIELRRPGKRRNSPLEFSTLEEKVKGDLPDAFDVRPILEKLWGCRKRVVPTCQEGEAPEADSPQFDDADSRPAVVPFRRRRAEGDAS